MVKRDYRNFNENEFHGAIHNLDWESIVDIKLKDPNLPINNFLNSVTYLLDEFAPNKKVTTREFKLNYKPWISKEILQQCRERDKLLKNVPKKMILH